MHDKVWDEKDPLSSDKIREILGDPSGATFRALSESLEGLFDYAENGGGDGGDQPPIQPLMSLNVARPGEAATAASLADPMLEPNPIIQNLTIDQTRLVISKLVCYQNLTSNNNNNQDNQNNNDM